MKLLSDEEIKIAIKMPTNLPLSFEAVGVDFERVAEAQAKLTHQEIVDWLKERNHGFEGRLFIIKIDFDEWYDFTQGNFE